MGINIQAMPDGKIQLVHQAQEVSLMFLSLEIPVIQSMHGIIHITFISNTVSLALFFNFITEATLVDRLFSFNLHGNSLIHSNFRGPLPQTLRAFWTIAQFSGYSLHLMFLMCKKR